MTPRLAMWLANAAAVLAFVGCQSCEGTPTSQRDSTPAETIEPDETGADTSDGESDVSTPTANDVDIEEVVDAVLDVEPPLESTWWHDVENRCAELQPRGEQLSREPALELRGTEVELVWEKYDFCTESNAPGPPYFIISGPEISMGDVDVDGERARSLVLTVPIQDGWGSIDEVVAVLDPVTGTERDCVRHRGHESIARRSFAIFPDTGDVFGVWSSNPLPIYEQGDDIFVRNALGAPMKQIRLEAEVPVPDTRFSGIRGMWPTRLNAVVTSFADRMAAFDPDTMEPIWTIPNTISDLTHSRRGIFASMRGTSVPVDGGVASVDACGSVRALEIPETEGRLMGVVDGSLLIDVEPSESDDRWIARPIDDLSSSVELERCYRWADLGDGVIACLGVRPFPVHVIDVRTGDQLREYRLTDFLDSVDSYGQGGWVLAANDGIVVVGGSATRGDDKFLALHFLHPDGRIESHEIRYQSPLRAGQTIQPPLLGDDGMLIIYAGQELLGIQTPLRGLARAEFPRGTEGGNTRSGWVEVID